MRKSYRVKKEAEFQKAFKQGESVANRSFVIYRLDVPDQKHFRVGISVGKKIGHTAVMRNRIKRYIRQSLLELKPDLKQDVDFLVIARKPSNRLDFFETKRNLIHVLKLAGLLAKDFETASK
ncbi:ribonuclease P [Agrilactobacillus composti DSM 18527 = JCM 14202]|uniref:Ribonuclease P protein component n=1 Tax=Agrilactobacillus composti DSM 18527 = JCM 14202 TaxID=1423734 RepID=X0QKY3_9LACO|nr:ribonuclease P protein component [Agrilactobacillus composti]KRM35008.1 ribonuclease P [Agrilactobacillus composti DSM 18527 = JCM 14202]GAF39290.1 ribonuclease P protein component [Agrilactobacillus composti DSM 18527 = JCM 14202]